MCACVTISDCSVLYMYIFNIHVLYMYVPIKISHICFVLFGGLLSVYSCR